MVVVVGMVVVWVPGRPMAVFGDAGRCEGLMAAGVAVAVGDVGGGDGMVLVARLWPMVLWWW
ncbi:extensin precursor [Iris pallida]|uniref:Extensin n=1 Tax=Iris pallida TaxID=29817 RepID=A0AAX6HRK3_IRIPA|nr:extensin precursor [Iris pallida]